MRVDVSEALKNPGISYRLAEDIHLPPVDLAKDMGCSLDIMPPVTLDCAYTAVGDVITFEGHVSARVVTECALCLDRVEMTVAAELYDTFSRGDIAEDEAMETHAFEGFHIDLADSIVASIILDLPMRIQCSDHCKGLCPVCGKNQNREVCGCARPAESAFDALKSLSFDQEEV